MRHPSDHRDQLPEGVIVTPEEIINAAATLAELCRKANVSLVCLTVPFNQLTCEIPPGAAFSMSLAGPITCQVGVASAWLQLAIEMMLTGRAPAGSVGDISLSEKRNQFDG